ncbi:hypothetical protein K461DRAFT_270745 [Myriangium duriaei CBS 260.36]|uniref:Uncharacterized protein n=1 Tax=Myriangium duriaei CBS 260.36 TaxID=1168546 RepID=A0A9P4IWP3_9PEZI|nr:hypothetical protein K461DRAFT_270745 [Myriangium duriaei CBS 260.36]
MLPQTLLTLALSTFALASPTLEVRQHGNSTTQLLNQITTIESNIAKLSSTLDGFKPNSFLGAGKALVIQFQTGALGTSLNKATEIINAAQTFNAQDSGNIAVAVLGLEPKIAALLNNIVTHKPAFSSVLWLLDLSQTVEDDLIEQKGESNEFGTALGQKLSGVFAAGAPLINAQIQQYFTYAVGNYSACTGVVCLPPIDI